MQVKIKDIIEGIGPAAAKGALCFVEFRGQLEDGTEFDSTTRHGRPFEFVLGSKKVIPGWSQGILGMRPGGEREIWVPAELAYGDRQVGLIRPHSNLIYKVKMLEVRLRED